MHPIDIIKHKVETQRIKSELEKLKVRYEIHDDNTVTILNDSNIGLSKRRVTLNDISFKLREIQCGLWCENLNSNSLKNLPENIYGSINLYDSYFERMSDLPIKFIKDDIIINSCGIKEIDIFPKNHTKFISLNYNNITSVRGFPKLLEDTAVYLKNNNIKTLDCNCQEIANLHLEGNPIESFGDLKRVYGLSVSLNNLNDSQELIKNLQRLHIITNLTVFSSTLTSKEIKEIKKMFKHVLIVQNSEEN
jgi:hypothetical protein